MPERVPLWSPIPVLKVVRRLSLREAIPENRFEGIALGDIRRNSKSGSYSAILKPHPEVARRSLKIWMRPSFGS